MDENDAHDRAAAYKIVGKIRDTNVCVSFYTCDDPKILGILILLVY